MIKAYMLKILIGVDISIVIGLIIYIRGLLKRKKEEEDKLPDWMYLGGENE